MVWGNDESVHYTERGVGFGKFTPTEKVTTPPTRYIYYNIPYGGVNDNYIFIGVQEGPKDYKVALYSGVEHDNTISLETILRIVQEKECTKEGTILTPLNGSKND